ncbi:cation-translocating P-type ATPase [Risungbinella massiliensis]|uniref:hypothetical protein n=1 Tax=Risungbinella massiliensis TaxID=1329796 RepID=UPI0005CC41F5|nr:hypothetical protein [Risungbinella massiliensis]
MIRRHGFKLTLINATGFIGMFILSMILYLVLGAIIMGVVGFDFLSIFNELAINPYGAEELLINKLIDSVWIFILVGLLFSIFVIVLSAFYSGGIYKSTAKAVFEDHVSYMDFFIQGFRYWVKLILLCLIQVVVMLVFFGITTLLYSFTIGTSLELWINFLVVIAELIIILPFSFAPIIIVQENVSAFKGVLLSFKLWKSPLSFLWTFITMFLIAVGVMIVFYGIGLLIAFFFGFFSDPTSFDTTNWFGIIVLIIYAIIFLIVFVPFTMTLITVYQVNRYRTTLRPKLFGGGNPPSGGGNGGFTYTPPTDPSPYNGSSPYVGYGNESNDSNNSTPSNYSFGSDPTPSTSNEEEQKPASGTTNTNPSHGGGSSFDPPSSSTPSNDGGNFSFGDQNNYTNYGSDNTNKW